jgi:transglutaminase/protease-like cytokinesis protein 3
VKIRESIFIILIFFSISSYSQINNFEEIEKYVLEVPKSQTKDIETLANYLKKNSKNKKEIVSRIYYWIAENIEYDWDAFINKKQIDVSAVATLQNRKSVCAGYAELFKAICDKAEIKCEIIVGYAKGYGYKGGKISKPNHAWNAVNIDDKWELVDSTWGIGGLVFNGKAVKSWCGRYLLEDPNEFILEHFPENEKWQLLEQKITIETFFSEEMEIKRKIRRGEI